MPELKTFTGFAPEHVDGKGLPEILDLRQEVKKTEVGCGGWI
jgi:hypothetical protein